MENPAQHVCRLCRNIILELSFQQHLIVPRHLASCRLLQPGHQLPREARVRQPSDRRHIPQPNERWQNSLFLQFSKLLYIWVAQTKASPCEFQREILYINAWKPAATWLRQNRGGIVISKLAWGVILASGIAMAQSMSCNLENFKPDNGIKAEQSGNSLILTWPGESSDMLRAKFTI